MTKKEGGMDDERVPLLYAPAAIILSLENTMIQLRPWCASAPSAKSICLACLEFGLGTVSKTRAYYS